MLDRHAIILLVPGGSWFRWHRSEFGMAEQKTEGRLAIVTAIAVLLLVCFSPRLPWLIPAEPHAAPQPALLQLPPGERVVGHLDGAVISNPDPTKRRRSLIASGWAVSAVADMPLKGVTVLVDDSPVGASSDFLRRADIAAVYGRPEFKLSGWRVAAMMPSPLAAGEHAVTLELLLADGESVKLPGKSVWAP